MYKNVIKDFQTGAIEKYIPSEFHHYFYIALGRRIAEKHQNNTIRGANLITEFPQEYRDFLCYGFVSFLNTSGLDALLYASDQGDVPFLKKHLFFRAGEIRGHAIAPSDTIKDFSFEHIPDDYVPYYMWGIGSGIYGNYFNDHAAIHEEPYNEVPLEVLQLMITDMQRYPINKEYMHMLYQGVGFAIGMRTFGELSYYNGPSIDEVILKEYRNPFYEGFGIGLAVRYGNDREMIKVVMGHHIAPSYTTAIEQGRDSAFSYLGIDKK